MSRIGSRIQELRNKKGISKKQLAKKIGASEKFIDDVELGKKVLPENILDKISKVLGQDLNDNTMNYDVESENDSFEKQTARKNMPSYVSKNAKKKSVEIDESWGSVFTNLIKKVPVYNYNLTKSFGEEEFLLNQNKVNGYNADKVIMVKVEDEDMIGFKIGKDDLAFCLCTSEFENDKFYLIEHKGIRTIKKVKKFDSAKAMLVRKETTERNEVVIFKDIKIIAKVIYVKVIL